MDVIFDDSDFFLQLPGLTGQICSSLGSNTATVDLSDFLHSPFPTFIISYLKDKPDPLLFAHLKILDFVYFYLAQSLCIVVIPFDYCTSIFLSFLLV